MNTSLILVWITLAAQPTEPGVAGQGGGADPQQGPRIAQGPVPQKTQPVDFLFQIRPILSEHCYACHGPDDGGRKAGLRLDVPEAFDKPLESGESLVTAGQPDESELLRRMVSPEEGEIMPPPATKNPLSATQIELVRRWISEGANRPPKAHWAFNPPSLPTLPAETDVTVVPGGQPVSPASGPSNPIDLFIAARRAKLGVPGAPEADRAALLRRLTLDLTGLPPTAAEIDDFQNDAAADAYERQVNRLLASPRLGERMAHDWLDLARYADTFGYQSDVERDMSPWRDWVISAFNRNLAFDQFASWQIAGDLLPGASTEQRLATAFNRLHRQTNEGGSIEAEFRAEYVADRVHTFGTAFLGLTLECSRCHDHKFDPIRQRDYYSLAAFFNNIDESGLYSHFTRAVPTPTLLLYPPGEETRHQQLTQRVVDAEVELARRMAAGMLEAGPLPAGGRVVVQRPQPTDRFPLDRGGAGVHANAVATDRPAALVDDPQVVPGWRGDALEFSGDNQVQLKGVGVFSRVDPFSFSVWIRPRERVERAVILHRSRAWTDSGSRGYELILDQGRPSFSLVHFYPGNAVHVQADQPLPLDQWSHLAVTYDGSSRAAGLRLYLNGNPLMVTVIRDRLIRDIGHRSEWGDDTGGVELTLAGRFRDAGFRHGQLDELQVFSRELTGLEVRRLADPADSPEQPATPTEWQAHYAARHWGPVQAAVRDLASRRAAENDLVTRVRELMVMHELPTRRATHVLFRGAYDQPREAVEPQTPEGILGFPAEFPRNRAGLAAWLTDPRNPLTARVVVNRIWRQHFGRGLVATAEDFGNQGALPTHPELLDWLAVWLRTNDWDLKGLMRLIVTSQAYRQSSRATADALQADPDNTWFTRGPRHRLSAEQIRDSALAAAGLLSGRLGGTSSRPYQPAGLWEEAGTGKSYQPDKGEGLYRRSLYTFWRRTAPPPTMLTFDATSREICTAKRETTATPLQSLVLLTAPQFVEAARVLAKRVLQQVERETPDAEGRRQAALRQV
ncbi:MAG: DUF1553 domain-containing protein, partial [Planctomycetaceae bacterium]